MPHRCDVKATAKFDAFGEVCQVDKQHQQVRDTLVPFPLEAVFGRPERVVAQPVHQRDNGFSFVKHGGEMLIRQPPFIDRCALQTNVFQVNVPRI